jgi:hypothetical protein
LLWPLRIVWLALPVAAGPTFVDALADVSRPVAVVASVGLYVVWAIVLLASLVPRPIGLTVVRIGGPAAVAATVWAVTVRPDGASAIDVVAVAWATLAAGAALAGVTADGFVDGPAYGDERRFALRAPMAVLLGPVELAWAAVVAGVAAGPLLLAAHQWVLGALALVAGAGAVVLGLRALHKLSRRWVVFVPAGVVLHDPMVLIDPVLFATGTVSSLGPASIGDPAASLDLTNGAPGLVIELRLRRPAAVPLPDPRPADRIRFTPVSPGAVLAEFASRSR